VSTTDIGNAAETAVAEQLARDGFSILDRNWKTKWCEVDIIASKDSTVWFVEVKYRSSNHFGDGLEYIGPQKLRHMQIAVDTWAGQHGYTGDVTLGAVAVTADNIPGELIEIV
jgi:Holliday junction resolvase-like predicted endonuclease